MDLFDTYVDPAFKFIKKKCMQTIDQVEISKVVSLCWLFQSLTCGSNTKMDWKLEQPKLHSLVCTIFFFCYTWTLGGNLTEKSMEEFDNFVRDVFGDCTDVKVHTILPYMYNVHVHIHVHVNVHVSHRYLGVVMSSASMSTLNHAVWRTGKALFPSLCTTLKCRILTSWYRLLIL